MVKIDLFSEQGSKLESSQELPLKNILSWQKKLWNSEVEYTKVK